MYKVNYFSHFYSCNIFISHPSHPYFFWLVLQSFFWKKNIKQCQIIVLDHQTGFLFALLLFEFNWSLLLILFCWMALWITCSLEVAGFSLIHKLSQFFFLNRLYSQKEGGVLWLPVSFKIAFGQPLYLKCSLYPVKHVLSLGFDSTLSSIVPT